MDNGIIKIMLVDNHKMIRQGLRSLLEKQSHLRIVAEADDGAMALAEMDKHGRNLDLTIMDIDMPRSNGLESAQQILKRFPNVKLIVLSMYSSEQLAQSMFLAGANAFTLKSRGFPELLDAIHAVMRGGRYLSPDVGGIMLARGIEKYQATPAAGFQALTPREREVLQHLAEGKTAIQTAHIMHLSAKTVEHYRARISRKLNLRNLAGLVKCAIREGITSVE